MKYQTFYFSSDHRVIPDGWFRVAFHFYRPFVFLVVLSLFPTLHPSCPFYICESSTVSTGRTAVDWNQRRKEVTRRLISGAQITSDAIIGKKNECGFAEDEIEKEAIGLAGYQRDYAGGGTIRLCLMTN